MASTKAPGKKGSKAVASSAGAMARSMRASSWRACRMATAASNGPKVRSMMATGIGGSCMDRAPSSVALSRWRVMAFSDEIACRITGANGSL